LNFDIVISLNNFFLKINLFAVLYTAWDNLVQKTSFIPHYYVRNENMWGDGFLFDFLQKKTADAWVRRFVIYTGFLFSERVVFEFVVRIYLDNMIWPFHHRSLFEASNTSEMLTTTVFLILTIILTTMLLLLYTVN